MLFPGELTFSWWAEIFPGVPVSIENVRQWRDSISHATGNQNTKHISLRKMFDSGKALEKTPTVSQGETPNSKVEAALLSTQQWQLLKNKCFMETDFSK